MKATATQFVHHALKDSILKIMESKQSCEVRVYCFNLYCKWHILMNYSFGKVHHF